MAKFRYRMQSILDIKLKMETQAKQEFAQAKLALDKEEETMERLKARKREYEEEARALLNGKLDVLEIAANKEAIIRMEEYIADQYLRVEKAKQLLEAARIRLTEVMQERKVHETLKEKAFEEFLMEEKQAESKEIDQLTSYTYGQKIMAADSSNTED
ncbi:MAG: flagellar export protein FliJ [Lachnospiraceae bacterium]|nr:flagellar export protein FliJ [Lachnospiraceae bacterium]